MEGRRPIPEAARATERLVTTVADALQAFIRGELKLQFEMVRLWLPKVVLSAVKKP